MIRNLHVEKIILKTGAYHRNLDSYLISAYNSLFMIRKILIANRGEIALRIVRTCRELDIESVAVYSTPDRLAPHVLYADEAYHIGEAPSSESYLQIDRLIDTAKRAECDAVHPGYGFLSENPAFAGSVRDAGLIFIGPHAESIAAMGDKVAARKKVREAGVPVIPGVEEPAGDPDRVAAAAEDIGYPVLIKAVGGGGGKGMRIVHTAEEMEKSLSAASSEAESSFGDPRIYLEKYLEEPHHIEIQILADRHGNTVHLFERECSVQRRYQKIIEESPSPFMTSELREKMGDAAVRVAEACDYVNAGTVEFLVDKHRNFYFLEMNTRLQVEHPVTEQITGIDLVQMQIRVADDAPLPWAQEEIPRSGHAIECRVYAEQPEHNFAPSTGKITDMHVPDGLGIRFDGGVYPGLEITPHYDPMIGKLICSGNSREEALSRSVRALEEFSITGVSTSLGFCRNVMQFGRFSRGEYDTHLLPDHLDDILELGEGRPDSYVSAGIAAAVRMHEENGESRHAQTRRDTTSSSWKRTGRRREMNR